VHASKYAPAFAGSARRERRDEIVRDFCHAGRGAKVELADGNKDVACRCEGDIRKNALEPARLLQDERPIAFGIMTTQPKPMTSIGPDSSIPKTALSPSRQR